MKVDLKIPAAKRDKKELDGDALVQQLKSMPPAKASQWADENIHSTADMKVVLKALILAACYLLRR